MSTCSLPSLLRDDDHTDLLAHISLGSLYPCPYKTRWRDSCPWDLLASSDLAIDANPFVFGDKVHDTLRLAQDAVREAGQEQMQLYGAYMRRRASLSGARPSKRADMERRAYLAQVAALPSVIARRAAKWFLRALLQALEMTKGLFQEVKELSADMGERFSGKVSAAEVIHMDLPPFDDEGAASRRPLLTMEIIDRRALRGSRLSLIDRDRASELREVEQDCLDGQSHWLIRVTPLREFDVFFGHLYEDEADSDGSQSRCPLRPLVIEETLEAIERATGLCQGVLSMLQDVDVAVGLFEAGVRPTCSCVAARLN